MTNLPMIFNDDEYDFIIIDGEPWLPATVVCAKLGLGDVLRAVSRLDDFEKRTHEVHTARGCRSATIVNQSGMLHLALTSRKPEAVAFRQWLTTVVVPAIYKKGGYIRSNATDEQVEALLTERQGLLAHIRTQNKQLSEADIRVDEHARRRREAEAQSGDIVQKANKYDAMRLLNDKLLAEIAELKANRK